MENLDLQQLSSDVSSIEDILYSLLGIGTLAVTGAGAIISLIIGIVGILGTIAHYLLQSIPLFIMARKAGYKHAWMAFFPYTNDYLTFILPIREFNIFNWIKTERRDMMALIYLGMILIGSGVVGFVAVITAGIPVIGPLISTFGGTILYIAILLFKWRMYYDLLMTFGQKSNAMWVSIISLFVPWLFMLFTVFSCKNPPEYGKGNYYMYRNQD